MYLHKYSCKYLINQPLVKQRMIVHGRVVHVAKKIVFQLNFH